MKKKFELLRTIGPSHLGSDGSITPTALVDLMQDCSLFQLDSEQDLTHYFEANKVGMYLSSRQINIVRLPRHGEKVNIVTWVYTCNPAYGYRNTNVYDATGAICAYSYATGVFVHLHSGQVTRIPQAVLDTVPIYEPYDMVYLPRRVKIPNTEPKAAQPFYVQRYLLDANKHINNAKYVAVAQEYIPEDFSPKQIRIEYQLPAKSQDLIKPLCYPIDNGFVIDLATKDNKHFAVVEFTH